MRAQPKRQSGDDRESMVGGRMLDEPVFDDASHEQEIDAAETQAAGGGTAEKVSTQPKSRSTEKKTPRRQPKKTDKEKGLAAKIKSAAKKVIKKVQDLVAPKKEGSKEVIINAEALETRVAVLEDKRLEEFTIERNEDERIVSSIYKGTVRNLEDRLEAAFVDIGIEKNAFLHYWDILPANLDKQYELVERKNKRRTTPRISRKDIPKKYPPGSDIIIQVQKGPIGTKGPRVTTHLSIPGRFLVLIPYSDQLGISKKISDPQERARLKEILRSLDIPDNMGAIIRTAGESQRKRYFVYDLAMLMQTWREVEMKIKDDPSPACVFREPDLVERTVRDFLTEDVEHIVIDNAEAASRIKGLISKVSRRAQDKVKVYRDARPIFDRHNITRQLEETFSRRVKLKSGGYIIIDETEALVSIDVNTGSHKGGKDQESTILKVNLEAAEEVCRQMRLRNIGGLIVIDFIHMKKRGDRNRVLQVVKTKLRRDKARTHVLPISDLGLMEMTRQRHSESVQSSVHDPCDYCKGRGSIKSALTMSVEIQRKLNEILKRRQADQSDYHLIVKVNPTVRHRLQKVDEDLIINMEKEHMVKLSFREEPDFHAEQFQITNGLNNEVMVDVGTVEEATS